MKWLLMALIAIPNLYAPMEITRHIWSQDNMGRYLSLQYVFYAETIFVWVSYILILLCVPIIYNYVSFEKRMRQEVNSK